MVVLMVVAIMIMVISKGSSITVIHHVISTWRGLVFQTKPCMSWTKGFFLGGCGLGT